MRIVAVVLLAALCAFQQAPPGEKPLPPGHPPINPLPPGHPPVTAAPAPQPGPAPPAEPRDTESADRIVDAYFGSMSGPPGAARDWDRFRSLFAPGSRLVTSMGGGGPVALSPEQFVQLNGKYFENSGYVERPVGRHVQAFGTIAHVLCAYESLRGADVVPYSRGVTSLQLLRGDGRWWIVSVLWDREREGVTLPADLVPAARGGA